MSCTSGLADTKSLSFSHMWMVRVELRLRVEVVGGGGRARQGGREGGGKEGRGKLNTSRERMPSWLKLAASTLVFVFEGLARADLDLAWLIWWWLCSGLHSVEET